MEHKGVKLNWRTLAVGLIGLVVVFIVARSLMGGGSNGGQGAVNNTGSTGSQPQSQGQSQPQSQPSTQQAPPPASGGGLNGSIAASGGPTLLLNPGLIRPGATTMINGFGFDGGSTVDLRMKASDTDKGTPMGSVKTDKYGNFAVAFNAPTSLGNSVMIVAQEKNSDKFTYTKAAVPAGMGQVKLAKTVGKPGDHIGVSVKGFAPNETINVYWGRLTGSPSSKLKADEHGTVGQGSIQIASSATGTSSLVLVGQTSQTVATATITMLSLYPSIKLHPYAVKAEQRLSFSAKGFAPGERILVYINKAGGAPAMIVQAGNDGGFANAGFVVPFGLKTKQSLILIGNESRATVSSGFTILPYMPAAQASTYGAFPGTTVAFYVTGFAPHEVVLVHNKAELISAFRVDAKGGAAGVGSYMIPGDAANGVNFTFTGRQSQAVANSTVKVMHSDTPVKLPPQPKYVMPPDLAKDVPIPNSISMGTPSGGAPAGAAPQATPGLIQPVNQGGQAPPAGGNAPAPADNNPAPAGGNNAPAAPDNNPAPAGGGNNAPAPPDNPNGP